MTKPTEQLIDGGLESRFAAFVKSDCLIAGESVISVGVGNIKDFIRKEIAEAYSRGKFEEGEERTKIWNKIIPEMEAEAIKRTREECAKKLEDLSQYRRTEKNHDMILWMHVRAIINSLRDKHLKEK